MKRPAVSKESYIKRPEHFKPCILRWPSTACYMGVWCTSSAYERKFYLLPTVLWFSSFPIFE